MVFFTYRCLQYPTLKWLIFYKCWTCFVTLFWGCKGPSPRVSHPNFPPKTLKTWYSLHPTHTNKTMYQHHVSFRTFSQLTVNFSPPSSIYYSTINSSITSNMWKRHTFSFNQTDQTPTDPQTQPICSSSHMSSDENPVDIPLYWLVNRDIL